MIPMTPSLNGFLYHFLIEHKYYVSSVFNNFYLNVAIWISFLLYAFFVRSWGEKKASVLIYTFVFLILNPFLWGFFNSLYSVLILISVSMVARSLYRIERLYNLQDLVKAGLSLAILALLDFYSFFVLLTVFISIPFVAKNTKKLSEFFAHYLIIFLPTLILVFSILMTNYFMGLRGERLYGELEIGASQGSYEVWWVIYFALALSGYFLNRKEAPSLKFPAGLIVVLVASSLFTPGFNGSQLISYLSLCIPISLASRSKNLI